MHALRVRRIETCKLNCAPAVRNTDGRLLECENSSHAFAMNKQNRKTHLYEIDRAARAARRTKPHTVKQTHVTEKRSTGEKIRRNHQYETTIEDAETRQVLMEAAQTFIGTIEFYKSDFGGGKPHDEAVKEALQCHEWRRGYVEGLSVKEISWGHMSAVGEVNIEDALKLWSRVREAADDELESGKRGAKLAGENTTPYSLAQYLAIRDSFADQWKLQGGIESAMVEMLSISYSLQMYWSTVAHERAMRTHDAQRDQVQRFESGGWKSPYQSEADAVDQAHRLADGYNRQFLRVLRQLRDLRRYAPVVIQNAQQVNVGNQQ
ncbi:MAG TPA: hypothetical protein VFS76_03295 [Pyrinomonadaceae bacterium]|nr:hypothetical protein [Pyrinomonadaceae bacterium]